MKKQLLKSSSTSRRTFLKQLAAGGAVAGLPYSQLHGAASPPTQKRVIFVYVPGGAPPEKWMPQGCANSFLLPQVSAPLEPVKHKCVFFDDISLPFGGPGLAAQILRDGYDSPTIDITLGKHLQEDAAHPNLFLSSTYEPQDTPSSYYPSEPDSSIWSRYHANPFDTYRNLFGGNEGSTNSSLPAFAESFAVPPGTETTGFDQSATLNAELAVLALRANKTRAVTLMLGDSEGNFGAPESGFEYFYSNSMHSFGPEPYAVFRTYLTRKVLYLIQLLQAMPDTYGRPLLDSTLVVQIADTGNGQDNGRERAPFMLAGGSNFVRNGLYLRNTGDRFAVLDTVSAALGLPELQLGNGPIRELFV